MPNLSDLHRSILTRAQRAGQTAPLMKRVAKELQVTYLEHFRQLESRGNKRGFPQRHFWNREVARYLTMQSDANTGGIQIASSAYLHKISGGRIVPKRSKALAIPMSPRAYAAGAPRVCGLPLIFIPDLSKRIIGWLVEHELYRPKGRRAKGGVIVHEPSNKKTLGTVHYLLVPHVDHQPMPDARPPQSMRVNRVTTVIRQWLDVLR